MVTNDNDNLGIYINGELIADVQPFVLSSVNSCDLLEQSKDWHLINVCFEDTNEYKLKMQVYRITKNTIYLRTKDKSKRITITSDELKSLDIDCIKSGYKNGDIVTCLFDIDNDY